MPLQTYYTFLVWLALSFSPGILLGNHVETRTFCPIDSIAPEFDCPAEVELLIDGTLISDPDQLLLKAFTNPVCSGIFIYFSSPSATDNCDPFPTVSQTNGLVSGSLFPLGSHAFAFLAVDSTGNESVCHFTIKVSPLPAIDVFLFPDTAVCQGTQVQLNPIVDTAASYEWTGPNGFFSTEIQPTIFADATTAGIYQLRCTSPVGCTANGSINLALLPPPVIEIKSNSPVCEDTLYLEAITSTSSPAIASWQWTGPCGFSSPLPEPQIPALSEDCAGIYTLEVLSVDGCPTKANTVIKWAPRPSPALQATCDSVLCLGESCLLLGSDFQPGPVHYSWSSNHPAAGLPASLNSNQVTVKPGEVGTYTYTYGVEVAGCRSSLATASIEVIGPPQAQADEYFLETAGALTDIRPLDNDTGWDQVFHFFEILSPVTNGQLLPQADGSFHYLPDQGFTGSDQFSYQICLDCDTELCSTATVDIQVTYDGICFIPTIITPNGDQTNDRLNIPCLESGAFPQNKLIVFNQWGDKVYEASPYTNDWEGTWRGEAGKDLPDGTYFYNFKRDQNSQIVKGYLSIYR